MTKNITRGPGKTSTAAETVAITAPGTTHAAHIQGQVEYREGDGPMIAIRRGPVVVEFTTTDATLSWTDGETRGSATMPTSIFRNYVSLAAIRLDA